MQAQLVTRVEELQQALMRKAAEMAQALLDLKTR
jgi:hypothetical protein